MREKNRFLTRRSFLAASAAAFAGGHPAVAGGAAFERISGHAFGTGWRVTAPAGSGLADLRPELEQILAEVDSQMSPWRPGSEIGRFNAGGAAPQRVSDDTATVTRAALDLARSSDGHFDPTVGPLVARWGFGPITGSMATGWQQISAEPGRIAKGHPGLTLDLCGIAKGFALDRIADHARGAGHDSVLIDIGGELVAVGTHPSGRPWQVAVESPVETGFAAAGILGLADRAVATSGLSAQGYRVSGLEYGHIIDPTTGDPARGTLRSVSVIADRAMMADGWATALFAAGASKGKDLARRHGIDALFLSEIGGRLETVATGDMAGALM